MPIAEPEAAERQVRFREQVCLERAVVFFNEPQKLATLVAAALQTYQQESAAAGGGAGKPRRRKPTGPGELARTERLYRAQLVERYRYLDFKGLGISDRVPLRLPLLEMYVPLKARVQTPSGCRGPYASPPDSGPSSWRTSHSRSHSSPWTWRKRRVYSTASSFDFASRIA
jgi:hypothetical protein